MGTVTVSVYLPESEAARLARAAGEMGLDQSTFLTIAVRRGTQALLFDRACDAHRKGDVSLSRSAEMADLGVRAMMLELQHHGMELNYGLNELAEDLQPLRQASDLSGRAHPLSAAVPVEMRTSGGSSLDIRWPLN